MLTFCDNIFHSDAIATHLKSFSDVRTLLIWAKQFLHLEIGTLSSLKNQQIKQTASVNRKGEALPVGYSPTLPLVGTEGVSNSPYQPQSYKYDTLSHSSSNTIYILLCKNYIWRVKVLDNDECHFCSTPQLFCSLSADVSSLQSHVTKLFVYFCSKFHTSLSLDFKSYQQG